MRCAEAEAVCRFVMPCAIWVRGEVNRRTYRMNETMTPMSMMPCRAKIDPSTHTATYDRLPMTFMSGCMMPERNCERQLAS